WISPGPGPDPAFFENFEGTWLPAGWLKLSPDGGTGWEPLSLGTTPLPGWTGGEATACPNGGSMQAFCTWITGGAASNDQWLITPQITVNLGDVLDFWMVYYENSYADHVEILISTTGQNNTANFTTVVDAIDFNVGAGTDWTAYSYNLTDFVSAGTDIYIAFREMVADNLNDGSAISIDNVYVGAMTDNLSVGNIQPVTTKSNTTTQVVEKDLNYVHVPSTYVAESTRGLLGFNVYRNSAQINTSLVSATEYTDENLLSGAYNYYVTAVYDEGESAPSNISTVYVEEPQHQFDPTWTTPYNPMTFYILDAIIDEIPLQTGDEIGLFDIDPNNGEEVCVGSSVLTESLGGGNYLEVIASMDDGFIPDQANGFTPGNPIIYKFWNETTGVVENITASYPYPGYDEVYTSQGTAFVELNGTLAITQTIDLQTGWNMMSFRVQPEEWNILNIVQPLIDDDMLYKVLDEAGGSIFHLPFPPPNGQWSNTIGNMANTEGYYIRVTDNAQLSLEGFVVETPFDIPLAEGWNMISYPREQPQNALDIVQPLIDAGILYKVIDESGGTIFHLPFPPPNGQWSNTIGNFESGKGYYLRVTDDAILTIDEPTDGATLVPLGKSKSETSFFNPVWDNNPYMPMHIIIEPSDILHSGDEVGVFDGEICVGSAVYDGNLQNPIIITTSMDDPGTDEIDGYIEGNLIDIKIWQVVNSSIAEDFFIGFHSGNMCFEEFGTYIGQIEVLTNEELQNRNNNIVQILPNPAKGNFFVHVDMEISDKGFISIYMINGQLIEKIVLNKNKTKINISNLEKGMYLIFIESSKINIKQKLIIN
nr:T9SS type A sorting domain-containing protein [Bacteroidota bacterium]